MIAIYNLPIRSTYLKAESQIQMRPIVPSVLKSSPVQSFCPNFRQLATGLVAKFLKTRQLATMESQTVAPHLQTSHGRMQTRFGKWPK